MTSTARTPGCSDAISLAAPTHRRGRATASNTWRRRTAGCMNGRRTTARISLSSKDPLSPLPRPAVSHHLLPPIRQVISLHPRQAPLFPLVSLLLPSLRQSRSHSPTHPFRPRLRTFNYSRTVPLRLAVLPTII